MILAAPSIQQPGSKPLSFDVFLAHYGDNDRYELIDGEIFDLEPTGEHEEIAAFVSRKVNVQIDPLDLPYFIPQRCLIKPPGLWTGFRPDLVVLDRDALVAEPRWNKEPIITLGSSIKFVTEVVSCNWQNDYSRKFEDYAELGIPEYWIIDCAGLEGVHHIGKPKQPTLTICRLVDDEYESDILRGNDPIVSTVFPQLALTAAQVLGLQY
jgi:Uma2 family endonuclease